MRTWHDKKLDINMCEPDCADEWLFNIWAIGSDYNGENTVEGLKKVIDELVDMSQKARQCLREGKLFGVFGSPKEE